MANYYGIFFSYGNTVIRLPINPSEVPTAFEGNNETLNVLGLGDVTITRKPKQKVIEFDSYFPARADRSVLTRGGFKEPEFYIQFFEAALKEGRVLTYTPVRKTEDGSAYDVQDSGFKCTVESFSAVEKGGETGDFYYSLTIKEWRDYSPQRVQVRNDALVLAKSRAVPEDQIVVGDTVQINAPLAPTKADLGRSTSAQAPSEGSRNRATGVVVRVEYDPEDNYDGQPIIDKNAKAYVTVKSSTPGQYEPYYLPATYDPAVSDDLQPDGSGRDMGWALLGALAKDTFNGLKW